jgi:peptidyl-prolyl cis-trans isomerase C
LLIGIGACGDSKPPPVAMGALEGDLVARVGREQVAADTVRRIAAAQSVSPADALDRAVFDAVWAAEARDKLAAERVEAAGDRVLARLLLADLARQARAEGAPTDDEVAAKTEKYWTRVARPASVVTGNAVVMVPKDSAEEVWVKAEAVAARVRAAAEAPAAKLARDEATYDFENAALHEPTGGLGEFLDAAPKVARDGFRIEAASTPPVAADNLTVTRQREDGQPFVESFVRRVMPLRPGEIMVFRTEFGVHVVVGVKSIPAEFQALEGRRQRFADEIYSDRTRRLTDALLADLKTRHRVDYERSADGSLAEVRVGQ